jgi:hypothetical protein
MIDSIDVVARGDDARLYHKRWQPGGWSEWRNECDAVMSGLPMLAADHLRRMHVFWRERQSDGSGSLKACARDAGDWEPVTFPLATNTLSFATTDSDLELDPSIVTAAPFKFQGASRSRNQTLLTFAILNQKSYWFHLLSSADLGPYPVTYVAPDRSLSAWIFGTLDGGIGATTWRATQ